MCPDGTTIIQEIEPGWSPKDVRDAFLLKADSHVDFHTDMLMDEIKEVLSGPQP